MSIDQVRANIDKVEAKPGYGQVWLEYTCDQPTAGNVVKTHCKPNCFPGESAVQFEGQGSALVASVSVGDAVLAQAVTGESTCEPVIGFIHANAEPAGAFGAIGNALPVVS